MIVQTIVQICAKYLISLLKTGGVMAISLVAMASVTLFLFPDVVFELIERKIGLYIFLVLLPIVSVHYVHFSEKLRKSFNRKR